MSSSGSDGKPPVPGWVKPSALAVSVMDLAAIAKRDEVIRAFERAQAAHEGARARPG